METAAPPRSAGQHACAPPPRPAAAPSSQHPGLRAAEEAEGLWSDDIWEAREQWREV